jgi:hypothetical protein
MPDRIIEDEFARFAEACTGTFRPVPVEAMPRWRRARRRGALWLGGLVAALLAALSANALQPAGPADPADRVVPRPVRLAGARGEMDVRFVDASHGWVLFSDCRPDDSCEHALGRTTDAGRTWTRVEPPRLPGRGRVAIWGLGPDAMMIGVVTLGGAWWQTSDGGRTYTSVPVGDIRPAEGFRPATVPLAAQSTPTSPARMPARDGVLWEVTHDGLSTRASYSTDRGATWRVLRAELPANGRLLVSPDGRDVWVVTDVPTQAWRLTPDGATARPDFPAAVNWQTVHAVDGGGLLTIVPGTGAGVWRDGRFTPLPAPLREAGWAIVLADGSIAVHGDDGHFVGREGGPWVHHTRP